MIRRAFKMKLLDGMAEEYRKRHNALWPEVKDMIKNYGGSNYSIFLDEKTNMLYGYIEIADPEIWAESRKTETCWNWWGYMSDLMETNPDTSPVSIPLTEIFHLD